MKCTRLFKKAYAAFDQRRGFERGRGGNLPSPVMAFFNIHVIDIIILCNYNSNFYYSPPVIFIAGRPKAALLFWFFGDFRCGVLLFMVIYVIYKYKNR